MDWAVKVAFRTANATRPIFFPYLMAWRKGRRPGNEPRTPAPGLHGAPHSSWCSHRLTKRTGSGALGGLRAGALENPAWDPDSGQEPRKDISKIPRRWKASFIRQLVHLPHTPQAECRETSCVRGRSGCGALWWWEALLDCREGPPLSPSVEGGSLFKEPGWGLTDIQVWVPAWFFLLAEKAQEYHLSSPDLSFFVCAMGIFPLTLLYPEH